MSSLDVSQLSPQDSTAALTSYKRRFRELIRPIADDEDIDELAERVGPEGVSAVEVASDVTRTWVLLGEALRQIAISDNPVVHPAVADPTQRDWETPPPASVEAALELLDDQADELVSIVAGVPTDSWTRTGSVAGGGQVQAIDVLRDAVLVGHDGLAAASRALEAARR